MRLIDADELHYSRIRIAHNDGSVGGYNAVVMSAEIKDAPTVDAVPVVRCRECKWRPRNMGAAENVENLVFPWDADSGDDMCPYSAGDPWYNKEPSPDGYCHLGEREVIDN